MQTTLWISNRRVLHLKSCILSEKAYLEYSMTAACKPRHTPNSGFFIVLAHLHTATFPSIPR